MAGKGGGAWKVAYADFVTAMMAFFLVMWIVAQNKDAKDAVSAYFRDPFGDSSRPSGTGHLEGSELKLKPPPETKLKGGAKVPILKMIYDRHGTPVGSYVQFVDDSAELDETAKLRLKDLTPLLIGKQNKIEVRGHTARTSPTAEAPQRDPFELSFARCLAVMKFLSANGIEESRLRLSQAGPYEPSAGAEIDGWRLRNSRVEIIMLNEYVDDFTVSRRRQIGGNVDDDEEFVELFEAAPPKEPGSSDGHGHAPAHGDGHGSEAAADAAPGHGGH